MRNRKVVMKNFVIILVFVTLLLCSCGTSKNTAYLEFPQTTWGMSAQEVLDAYGITKEDTAAYEEGERNTYFMLKDQELFGEKTANIAFNFLDLGSGRQELCAVRVFYAEDADMNKVLAKMEKTYGDTIPELTSYFLLSPLGDGILTPSEYTESEHLKLWGSSTLKETISEEEMQNYAPLWEEHQPGLDADSWQEFSENVRLVHVTWNDDERPGLDFDAYNLAVYNELTRQLSEQQ